MDLRQTAVDVLRYQLDRGPSLNRPEGPQTGLDSRSGNVQAVAGCSTGARTRRSRRGVFSDCASNRLLPFTIHRQTGDC